MTNNWLFMKIHFFSISSIYLLIESKNAYANSKVTLKNSKELESFLLIELIKKYNSAMPAFDDWYNIISQPKSMVIDSACLIKPLPYFLKLQFMKTINESLIGSMTE